MLTRNWARRASKFVLEFLKMGRSPQFGKFVTSRPAQIRVAFLKCRPEFQICKLGPKSTIEGTQNAKVVYPPPPEGQITGIEKCVGKMEPRRPLIQPLRGSTPPKMADFEAKITPKRGQQRGKWGMPVPKSTPKSLFCYFWGWRGGRGQKRPKSPQTPIFSGSPANWA